MAKKSMKRREFIEKTGFGLAALGVSGLVLRSDALPTQRSSDTDLAEAGFESLPGAQTQDLSPTMARELGPFYRSGSPYRAKLTPPFEEGTVLIVTGRVWSFATKKPLPNTLLDLWQVDNQTRDYSKGNGDFKNRARLLTDENGAYEFETVHPVPYQPGPKFLAVAARTFHRVCRGPQTSCERAVFQGRR